MFAGLSVLVMGYPCAVGISAPLSIVRGAGEAAEHGILMRTGEAFQGYRLVDTVVLDKTGTLTEGRPVVREIEVFSGSEAELVALAAAAEASSEHPLAQAVVRAAFARGAVPPEVTAFEASPGKGVTARIADGEVLVGSPAFLEGQGIDLSPARARIAALEEAGRTVVVVGRNGRALGLLALDDRLRADAAQAVAALRKEGLRTVLLTGDNERAARRIAAEAGIDEVHAGVLPADRYLPVVQKAILQESGASALKKGSPYSIALISAEIDRLTKVGETQYAHQSVSATGSPSGGGAAS